MCRIVHEDSGGGKIYLYYLDLAIDGVDGQHHAPAALPAGKLTANIVEEFGLAP
jgi:hypothetical protein